MNGKKYLLDTNAIVALFQGNEQIAELLKSAEWIGISVISKLEFLCNPALNEEDKTIFRLFEKRITIIGLLATDQELNETIVYLRLKYKIKLPDAIISATALNQNCSLVTMDRDFSNIKDLKLVSF